MAVNAEEIFITIGTTDPAQPYAQVTLQTFADMMLTEMLDRQAETRKLLDMITSLSATVETMQLEFSKIGQALHATTVQARGLMARKAPGVN